jgi:hypothetical protein
VALLALGHDLEPEDRLLGDLDHGAVGDARVGDDDEIILLEDVAVAIQEKLYPVLAPGLLVGDEDEADVVGRSGAKLAEGLSGDSAKEILAANMCLETPISLYLE